MDPVISADLQILSSFQLWETLFDQSNDAMLVIDSDLESIIHMNEAANSLFNEGSENGQAITLKAMFGAQESSLWKEMKETFADQSRFHAKNGFFLNAREGIIPVEFELRQLGLTKCEKAIAICKPLKVDGFQVSTQKHLVCCDRDDGWTETQGASQVDDCQQAQLLAINQHLIEVAGDAVYWIKKDGSLTYANQAAAKSLGYSIEELLKLTVFDIDAESDPSEWPHIWQLVSNQGHVNFEREHRRKDGSRFPVEITSTHTEFAGEEIGIAIARDVSKRKQTEATLTSVLEGTGRSTGEEFYRSIVEHLATALDMKFAAVAEVIPDQDRARTLAVWDHGALADNFEYDLAGTPCEQVTQRSTCVFPANVQEQFPTDIALVEMGVHCYIGTVLRTNEGRAAGLLIAADDKPRSDLADQISILEIFSNRAAAELQRIKYQQRLQDSEAKFRALAESNPALVSICIDFVHAYANPAYMSLLGYEPEDLIGKSMFEYMHSDFHELAKEKCKLCMQGNVPVKPFEVKFIHQDGRELWFELGGKRIEYQGKPASMVVAMDVNERKQSELALVASEQKLAAIAETMPHAMYVFDLVKQCTTYSNREVWQSLGYPDGHLPDSGGKAIFDLMHPEDLARIPELLSRWNDAKDGQIFETEYRLKHADGSWHWFLGRDCVHRRNERGEVVAIIGTTQDVTERKQLENKLLRFRDMLNQASEAIIVVEARTGKIRDVNDTACRALGYSNEELLSLSVFDIQEKFQESPNEKWNAHMEQVRSKEVCFFKGTHLRKDGTKFPVEVALTMKEFDEQEYVIGFVRNISERLEAEATLHRSQQRLKERELQLAHVGRLSIVGEAVAGIAHEVTQPLFAIANFAKASIHEIEQNSATPVSLHQRFDKINKLAMTAGDILKRVGQFTRKGQSQSTTFSICEAINESIELLGFEIRKHDVSISVECNQNYLVNANLIQIQQVFTNLLKNAIDATEFRKQGERTLKINVDQVENNARVIISDNGIGFNGEDPEKSFDAFHSTKPDGMGMGLAICRTIINAHYGKIWATENSDGGATIQFTLPLADGINASS